MANTTSTERPDFTATVRQVYALADRHLLVLQENYRGDIGPGDLIEVSLPDASSTTVRVRDLAWGSAFTSQNPPLTLIVDRIEGAEPRAGATVRPAS